MAAFADAAAPGIVFAQAIGRWGNWFNNELYGGPTSLPWRLQIHKIDVVTGHLTQCDVGNIGTVGVCGYYQPTFLYESLWDLALGFALLYVGRRFVLGQGNLFALYVMGYTVGRGLDRGAARGPRESLPGRATQRLDGAAGVPGRCCLVLPAPQRAGRSAVPGRPRTGRWHLG